MMLTGWDVCACGHFRNAHHAAEGCLRTEWVRDEDDYTYEHEAICPCQKFTSQTATLAVEALSILHPFTK